MSAWHQLLQQLITHYGSGDAPARSRGGRSKGRGSWRQQRNTSLDVNNDVSVMNGLRHLCFVVRPASAEHCEQLCTIIYHVCTERPQSVAAVDGAADAVARFALDVAVGRSATDSSTPSSRSHGGGTDEAAVSALRSLAQLLFHCSAHVSTALLGAVAGDMLACIGDVSEWETGELGVERFDMLRLALTALGNSFIGTRARQEELKATHSSASAYLRAVIATHAPITVQCAASSAAEHPPLRERRLTRLYLNALRALYLLASEAHTSALLELPKSLAPLAVGAHTAEAEDTAQQYNAPLLTGGDAGDMAAAAAHFQPSDSECDDGGVGGGDHDDDDDDDNNNDAIAGNHQEVSSGGHARGGRAAQLAADDARGDEAVRCAALRCMGALCKRMPRTVVKQWSTYLPEHGDGLLPLCALQCECAVAALRLLANMLACAKNMLYAAKLPSGKTHAFVSYSEWLAALLLRVANAVLDAAPRTPTARHRLHALKAIGLCVSFFPIELLRVRGEAATGDCITERALDAACRCGLAVRADDSKSAAVACQIVSAVFKRTHGAGGVVVADEQLRECTRALCAAAVHSSDTFLRDVTSALTNMLKWNARRVLAVPPAAATSVAGGALTERSVVSAFVLLLLLCPKDHQCSPDCTTRMQLAFSMLEQVNGQAAPPDDKCPALDAELWRLLLENADFCELLDPEATATEDATRRKRLVIDCVGHLGEHIFVALPRPRQYFLLNMLLYHAGGGDAGGNVDVAARKAALHALGSFCSMSAQCLSESFLTDVVKVCVAQLRVSAVGTAGGARSNTTNASVTTACWCAANALDAQRRAMDEDEDDGGGEVEGEPVTAAFRGSADQRLRLELLVACLGMLKASDRVLCNAVRVLGSWCVVEGAHALQPLTELAARGDVSLESDAALVGAVTLCTGGANGEAAAAAAALTAMREHSAFFVCLRALIYTCTHSKGAKVHWNALCAAQTIVGSPHLRHEPTFCEEVLAAQPFAAMRQCATVSKNFKVKISACAALSTTWELCAASEFRTFSAVVTEVRESLLCLLDVVERCEGPPSAAAEGAGGRLKPADLRQYVRRLRTTAADSIVRLVRLSGGMVPWRAMYTLPPERLLVAAQCIERLLDEHVTDTADTVIALECMLEVVLRRMGADHDTHALGEVEEHLYEQLAEADARFSAVEELRRYQSQSTSREAALVGNVRRQAVTTLEDVADWCIVLLRALRDQLGIE